MLVHHLMMLDNNLCVKIS